MNLHDIRPKYPTEAWCWAFVNSALRYQALRMDGLTHAFRIERSAPDVPLGHMNAYMRSYFRPFIVRSRPQAPNTLTPLCGANLARHTRARLVRLLTASFYGADMMDPPLCPRCVELGGTYQRTLQQADPWNAMNEEARITLPDPVSGL